MEAGISLDAAILRVARELRLAHRDLSHELLIVNRKTREEGGRPLWGTRYDAKEDVARIPMTVSRSAGTVERFRITLDGGALRMAWENTVASVPVAAR